MYIFVHFVLTIYVDEFLMSKKIFRMGSLTDISDEIVPISVQSKSKWQW